MKNRLLIKKIKEAENCFIEMRLNNSFKKFLYKEDNKIFFSKIINSPDFLDFLINNFFTNNRTSFNEIEQEYGSKAFLITRHNIKIALRALEVLKEIIMRNYPKESFSVNIEKDFCLFSIESIVILKEEKSMQEVFDYKFIEERYPEYFI